MLRTSALVFAAGLLIGGVPADKAFKEWAAILALAAKSKGNRGHAALKDPLI